MRDVRMRATVNPDGWPFGPLKANKTYALPDALAKRLLASGAAVAPGGVEAAVVEAPENAALRTGRLTPRGGGWYELPDGRRVQGEERALAELNRETPDANDSEDGESD